MVSAAEGRGGGERVRGRGERGRECGGERRKLVERHWSGQCPKRPYPERPFPPIAVAVNADQSVVVQ